MQGNTLLISLQESINALFRAGIPELGQILGQTCATLEADRCLIYFRDHQEPGKVCLLKSFPEKFPGPAPKKITWMESPFADLMSKGTPYIRGKADLLFSLDPKFAIPLVAGKLICGFLSVERKALPHSGVIAPDPEHLVQVGIYLGNLIGLILDNQDLRSRMELLQQEVEAEKERNTVLSNSLQFLDRESDSLFFEKEVIQTELSVAKEIQEKFFPREKLTTPLLSVFGTSHTASAVGGDFFDYFVTPQGWVVVLLGDVAGHGVPAAMVVAMVRGLVTYFTSSFNPATAQTAIHDVLLRFFKKKKMMTGFFAVFSPQFRKIVASNAGQCYPYRIRRGKISSLDLKSPPMGVLSKVKFTSSELQLELGDVYVFYSDGFVEALDTEGNQVGFPRFEEVLLQQTDQNPEVIERNLRAWHKEITGGKPLLDDVTLVVVKIKDS